MDQIKLINEGILKLSFVCCFELVLNMGFVLCYLLSYVTMYVFTINTIELVTVVVKVETVYTNVYKT